MSERNQHVSVQRVPFEQPENFVRPEARVAGDANFQSLVNQLRLGEYLSDNPERKRLIVFLGAGASAGAVNKKQKKKLPTASFLRDQLWIKFMCNGDETFDTRNLGMMSLEHAAAIIEAKRDRGNLIDEIVEQFDCDGTLWQHIALRFLKPKAIFTTNYDELIENTDLREGVTQNCGKIQVIHDDISEVIAGRTPLYKPHGTLTLRNKGIGSGGLVITQFDYFSFDKEYHAMLTKFLTDF
jgi:hypothetical protein